MCHATGIGQIPPPRWQGDCSESALVSVVDSSSGAVRKLGWRSRQEMLGARPGGGRGSANREGVWHAEDI